MEDEKGRPFNKSDVEDFMKLYRQLHEEGELNPLLNPLKLDLT